MTRKITVNMPSMTKEIMVKTRNVDRNGTSLMGYVTCTRKYLTTVFGEPEYDDGDDKVMTEWVLEAEGVVFTLYDWKEYRKIGMDELYEWHIGGHDKNAVKMVALLTGLPTKTGPF